MSSAAAISLACLKTVIVVQAGIHADYANSRRTLSINPRWREDDAVNADLRVRKDDVANVRGKVAP